MIDLKNESQLLTQSTWDPDRSVNPERLQRFLNSIGYSVCEKTVSAISSFGGLTFETQVNGQTHKILIYDGRKLPGSWPSRLCRDKNEGRDVGVFFGHAIGKSACVIGEFQILNSRRLVLKRPIFIDVNGCIYIFSQPEGDLLSFASIPVLVKELECAANSNGLLLSSDFAVFEDINDMIAEYAMLIVDNSNLFV